MNPQVLIQRDYNGIGDWLMALATMKMVNRQRPDVDLFVNFSTKTRLPEIVPQSFAASDVRHRIGTPCGEYRRAHNLVYRKWPPDSYIESMVLNLNDLCGLNIKFEPGVYPQFGHTPRDGSKMKSDYVVMVSQGKRFERANKEWGYLNFKTLSALLYPHTRVIQIGSKFDKPLVKAHGRILGGTFANLVRVMLGARAFIGIENGMMVLAGFLGVRQVTIYDGWAMGARSKYEGQLQLLEKIEPHEALGPILEWI